MVKESRAFGSKRAAKEHLLRGGGGLAGEIADLRNDVEEGFQNLEGMAGFPFLDFVDGAGPAAAGGDMVLVGRNLLQDQTFDSLALWAGTSLVTITCLKPGNSEYTITVVGGGTAGSEAVTKSGNNFEIEIEVGVSTANQIATAINADGADSDGYLRAASGGAGTTNAVQAETAMTGGVGDFAGNTVYAAGKECLPANTTGTAGAAAWTNTGVTVTVPALAPAVATDKASIILTSDGTAANPLTVAVE